MKKSPDTFFSEEIDVQTGPASGRPAAFTWRGRRYAIREIWGEWPDYGFGAAPTGRWWQRRHRTYYRVVTDGEEVFEIYLDRGGHRKQWYLYRSLGTEPTSEEAGR
jgi:hypothetical protein